MRRIDKVPVVQSAIIVMLTLLAGCGKPAIPASGGGPRIISLGPSATEILFAIGAGGSVVGVTVSCDYPPEARQVERVGDFGAPNVEKMISLHPTLIITGGLEGPDALRVLRGLGAEVLVTRTGNFDELFATIRQIGQAVGKADAAERLVASMQADLDAVAKESAALPGASPRVFVEIGHDPLMTVSAGSFLDEIIARAGGVNVAHDVNTPYPTINPEKVIDWKPDVILLGSMSPNEQAVATISSRIGWADIPAVRNRQVISDINPDLLLRPGPRMAQGVRLLAERLRTVREGQGSATP